MPLRSEWWRLGWCERTPFPPIRTYVIFENPEISENQRRALTSENQGTLGLYLALECKCAFGAKTRWFEYLCVTLVENSTGFWHRCRRACFVFDCGACAPPRRSSAWLPAQDAAPGRTLPLGCCLLPEPLPPVGPPLEATNVLFEGSNILAHSKHWKPLR